MDKMILKKLVEKGCSTREIAEAQETSQTNVRYWLKKHDLKTVLQPYNYGGTNSDRSPCCKKCGENDSTKFYIRQGKLSKSCCKKCFNKDRIKAFRQNKLDAIAYKGGKCVKCGYKKCPGSMHFHHLDPTKKDVDTWRLVRNRKLDSIKKELDKCILVCGNCHGEIHWDIDGVSMEERLTG